MAFQSSQLELFPRTDIEKKEEELIKYKKKVFNSIRGLYARNTQLNENIKEVRAIMDKVYKIDFSKNKKIELFQSDAQKEVQALLECENEFLNSELMLHKKISERSMNSLEFKYNESEREILFLKKVLMDAVFKEMDRRAQV